MSSLRHLNRKPASDGSARSGSSSQGAIALNVSPSLTSAPNHAPHSFASAASTSNLQSTAEEAFEIMLKNKIYNLFKGASIGEKEKLPALINALEKLKKLHIEQCVILLNAAGSLNYVNHRIEFLRTGLIVFNTLNQMQRPSNIDLETERIKFLRQLIRPIKTGLSKANYAVIYKIVVFQYLKLANNLFRNDKIDFEALKDDLIHLLKFIISRRYYSIIDVLFQLSLLSAPEGCHQAIKKLPDAEQTRLDITWESHSSIMGIKSYVLAQHYLNTESDAVKQKLKSIIERREGYTDSEMLIPNQLDSRGTLFFLWIFKQLNCKQLSKANQEIIFNTPFSQKQEAIQNQIFVAHSMLEILGKEFAVSAQNLMAKFLWYNGSNENILQLWDKMFEVLGQDLDQDVARYIAYGCDLPIVLKLIDILDNHMLEDIIISIRGNHKFNPEITRSLLNRIKEKCRLRA